MRPVESRARRVTSGMSPELTRTVCSNTNPSMRFVTAPFSVMPYLISVETEETATPSRGTPPRSR